MIPRSMSFKTGAVALLAAHHLVSGGTIQGPAALPAHGRFLRKSYHGGNSLERQINVFFAAKCPDAAVATREKCAQQVLLLGTNEDRSAGEIMGGLHDAVDRVGPSDLIEALLGQESQNEGASADDSGDSGENSEPRNQADVQAAAASNDKEVSIEADKGAEGATPEENEERRLHRGKTRWEWIEAKCLENRQNNIPRSSE